MSENAVQRQREYYAQTAAKYDQMHLSEPEHEIALAQLSGYLNHYQFDSLLDVGAGTGRVLRHLGSHNPKLKVCGVEPVAELREIAYHNGVAKEEMIDGDATRLDLADNSWDVVCAFGILHHIENPELAVAELCRVARKAVFISDCNNFGCGSLAQRSFAQTLHRLGLWRRFQWVKNGGRYDKYSEGDGVHYSYSLFDSLKTIEKKFPQYHLTNTRDSAPNLYRRCANVSVFAVESSDALVDLNINLGSAP